MEAVLDEFQPDVVHLHNVYHQLSPSILGPLARRGVPAVMTLHDYKLTCPTYRMLDHGQICNACVGGHFHNAVLKRCNRGSLGASAVVAIETAVHRRMGAYRPVGVFICPSRFIARTMRSTISAARIVTTSGTTKNGVFTSDAFIVAVRATIVR